MVNVEGDSYGAGIVMKLSEKDLEELDAADAGEKDGDEEELHVYDGKKSVEDVIEDDKDGYTMDVLQMDTHRYLNEFMHLSVSKVSQ